MTNAFKTQKEIRDHVKIVLSRALKQGSGFSLDQEKWILYGAEMRFELDAKQRPLGEQVLRLTIENDRLRAALREESILQVVRKWKRAWMNQTKNGQADHENYFNRAFGVDANMQHSLAKMISESALAGKVDSE